VHASRLPRVQRAADRPPPPGMAPSRQALNRLRKELKAISADPPPYIHVYCDDSDILSWSYLLEGPPDTPYEGGWYWGRLKFPKDYPFAPPSILMVTPNGRFETNTRLCLSMSDYHPESWQPSWSLATVLKGLLSFMCEDTPTAGAIDPIPSVGTRRRLAASSLEWNKAQADFMKAYAEVDSIVAEARALRPPKASEAVSAAAAGAAPTALVDDRPTLPPGTGVDAAAGADGGDAKKFTAGDKVMIQALQSRDDLNGREGEVEAPDEKTVSAGRVRVRVADEVVGVKPENLTPVRGTSAEETVSSSPPPAGADEEIFFEKVDDDRTQEESAKA